MVQTGPAVALILTTLLSLLLVYFATIKYTSEILLGGDDHGDDGDHAA
jgi:hypothetical protein